MKTVIMAGGKGTRISSIASDIPKPMIPVDGMPVLEHEINSLREQGFTDIIITVSHLGNIIMDYFGDGSKISPITNKQFGVSIEYFNEEKPLGTAGALFQLKDKLTEDFLLLNGDAIFDIDFNRFVTYHKKKGGLVTLFTHPNNHPYDSGLIIANKEGIVERWLSKEDERPTYYKNRVNAGLHIISPKVLDVVIETDKIDLDRQILKPLAGTGKMFVYDSPEYVKDMGTPERYNLVQNDYKNGIVEGKNLKHKQKAIFLDRDGTINKYVGFVRKKEEFELLPHVSETIRKFNELGFLVIIITNQPVIARGEVSYEELEVIHNKMETLLGNDGAYVDAIYYCPHHPDKGFDGEIVDLKIDCDCRKPKPGLIFKAAEDFNIDLENSWMIGDSENDIVAGKRAGCKTILVNENYNDYKQDFYVTDIKEILNIITNKHILSENIVTQLDKLIERYPQLNSIKNQIYEAYLILENCYENKGKLLIAGNGGSASDSEHIVGELMKSFNLPRKLSKEYKEKLIDQDIEMGTVLANNLQGALPAIALDGHYSLSTAYLNDCNPLLCFAQQVNGYGVKGDVLLAISTSGNSKNILYAAVCAKAKGMKVIGLTGEKESSLSKLADICIKAPAIETYMVQELHLPIYHCISIMLEKRFFNE